jgi:hypothetical protein
MLPRSAGGDGGGELGFRAEAVVPITDLWALAVRYVPALEEWTAYTATVAGAMDAAAQAVTATWTFTTGDFTQSEVVATSPEKESQGAAPAEVIAYFSEDVSTAGATFTLTGEKEGVDGELAYDNEVPCDPEAPSCYQWHFTPYEPLLPGLYTAEVSGVTDRAGLGMEGPYGWSFEVTDGIGAEGALPARGVAGPAVEGGAIEGGAAGVLYVRRTSYYYFNGQMIKCVAVATARLFCGWKVIQYEIGQPRQGWEMGIVRQEKAERCVSNGQVIAIRRGETFWFLRPDHLGLASLVLDSGQEYLAWVAGWPTTATLALRRVERQRRGLCQLSAGPALRRLLIDKVGEGLQFCAYLRQHLRGSIYQGAYLGPIEPKGIDITDHVPEPSVFLQPSAGVVRDHRWPQSRHVGSYLLQQHLVPAFAAWHAAVDGGGNHLQQALQPGVKAVQIQGYAIQV